MQGSKRVKTILKNIDTFGQPILLSYKGKTEYQTWFGGLLTCLLLGTIVFFSLDAISSLINRENISVALSTIYEEDPYYIEVSADKGFFLAVGLYPDLFNNITNRHFNIYAEQRYYRRYENGTEERDYIPLELKPCQQENFPEGYNFMKYNQENWLCLNKSQTLLLEGNFQSNKYRHIKIGVDRCRNRTDFNGCAPANDTEALIKTNKIYLDAHFTNKLINLQDYNKPISSFMEKSLSCLLDPAKYYKQADVYFRHNTILIDDNLWLYDQKKSTEITFESFREQVMDVNSDRLAALFLNSASNRGVYNAKVEKLTISISRLGGLISVLFSVIEIIARYYNRKKLLVSLANFLYNFIIPSNDSKSDGTPKLDLENSIGKVKSIGKDNLSNTDDFKILETNSTSDKIFFKVRRPVDLFENKNEKKVQIASTSSDNEPARQGKNSWNQRLTENIKKYLNQFSKIDISWKLLPSFFGRKERKRKQRLKLNLFDKAIEKMDRDLDIIQILETVKGVDKLKEFLFKDHQRVLFEFFPKPVISSSSFDLNKVIKQSQGKKLSKKMTVGKRILKNEYLMRMMNKTDRNLSEEASLYIELFKAFNLATQEPIEKLDKNNQKLVSFLGENLLTIFKKTVHE